jgi:serine/threonine-protein kinase
MPLRCSNDGFLDGVGQTMTTASEADVPQELVAGKYRLVRLLGRGGMGSVWEGTHTSLGTRVAVKFIEAEYAGSAEARQRFENEARAAATLRSKHVVQVYDHGVTPAGNPFIVMEFLGGEPLDKRLDRVGRLPPQEVSRIIQHVCRALAKAHEAGIVHRDLKPENVFLVWDDDDSMDIAKVVDFGIAKFTDKSMGVSSSTRTGSVLGTPFYMSPEQARGLRSVDYRSDLWSVGVIAFRCITGRLPFEGEAIGDLLVKICTAPLPVPSQWAPGIPPGFDDWFVRALNRDPAGRFNTAPELAEALAVACGTAPSRAHSGVGTGSHVAAVSAPFPQQSWPQPSPAGASSSYSSHQSGSNPAAMTGAAFTQTPIAGVPTSSKAPIVVAVLAGLLVLGGGAALAATLLKHDPPPAEPAVTPTAPAETTAPTAAPPAITAPAPEVVPATAAPSASVASAARPAETPKPAIERRQPSVKPRLPSGTSTVKAKPEATKPKAEATKPKVEEKPKPVPAKPPGIDVGY